MLSELPEARLVATPGRPKEVLISDDPPDSNTALQLKRAIADGQGLHYPEWDYRGGHYRQPGATVRLLPNLPGSQKWVDDTLDKHRALLNQIRRRFEMLRARRVTRRRQLDGDEIDLHAYIDSYADFRAGGSLSEALYQCQRRAERDLAITLLIDVSGSTDGWVSAERRVIDVEREALLLVCIALDGLGSPMRCRRSRGRPRCGDRAGAESIRRNLQQRGGAAHQRAGARALHSPAPPFAMPVRVYCSRPPLIGFCCCSPMASRTTRMTTRAATAWKTCVRRSPKPPCRAFRRSA